MPRSPGSPEAAAKKAQARLSKRRRLTESGQAHAPQRKPLAKSFQASADTSWSAPLCPSRALFQGFGGPADEGRRQSLGQTFNLRRLGVQGQFGLPSTVWQQQARHRHIGTCRYQPRDGRSKKKRGTARQGATLSWDPVLPRAERIALAGSVRPEEEGVEELKFHVSPGSKTCFRSAKMWPKLPTKRASPARSNEPSEANLMWDPFWYTSRLRRLYNMKFQGRPKAIWGWVDWFVRGEGILMITSENLSTRYFRVSKGSFVLLTAQHRISAKST